MKISTLVSIFLVAAYWPAQGASAQHVVPAGHLDLAGYRVSCGPVQTVVMHMEDIAVTQGGRIYLNSTLLTRPRAEQIFWYTHECAHMIFGAGEMRADCWAVKQGRIQGWLQPSDFDALSASMRLHPGDRTHPAGPQRVGAMASCFNR